MDLRTAMLLGATLAVFMLASWALAHIAKRLPDAIPRSAKIAVSGTAVPFAFFGLSFLRFEEKGFFEWITTLPARSYFLMAVFFGAGCLVARFVLRARRPKDVTATFE